MTEECRLITKEEWDNYLLTCKTCEDLYKCLLNIVEAESWEEAHDLAEDMIVKYADKFDVAQENENDNLLKTKLNLAINALKEIKSMTFDRYLMNTGWLAVDILREEARKVLKQIGDEE